MLSSCHIWNATLIIYLYATLGFLGMNVGAYDSTHKSHGQLDMEFYFLFSMNYPLKAVQLPQFLQVDLSPEDSKDNRPKGHTVFCQLFLGYWNTQELPWFNWKTGLSSWRSCDSINFGIIYRWEIVSLPLESPLDTAVLLDHFHPSLGPRFYEARASVVLIGPAWLGELGMFILGCWGLRQKRCLCTQMASVYQNFLMMMVSSLASFSSDQFRVSFIDISFIHPKCTEPPVHYASC